MECIWRSTLIALLTLTFLQGVGLGEESTGKISSLVLSKLEQMSADAQLGYTEEELGERHSSMFVFIDELARIYVRIVPEEGQAEGVGIEIAGMGGVVLNSTEEEIYCLINYTKVPAFEEMSGVLFVGIGPLPQVRTGSVTSEGDAQLFADKARDLFYTDGSNVMIGVISDGMQHRQNSINSGDLPPNIISIDFAHEYEGSEGTAMMEIVHDLAPGAQLAFGAVGRRNNIWATPLDMANRITHLRQAGCKVIVDDIGWPVGYSQFEDREITSSIEQFVQSSGGSYVSACGNDREIMWAGSSAPSGFHARKWMVFGADSALNVSVSEQGTLFVELQWADPWTNSLDDLDLFLMNQNGTIVASSATGGGSGIPPEENIEYSASAGTYRILVEWRNWYAGRPAKDFKLLVWGGSISSTSNYHVYGHAAAQNAISVAAYSASTPNTIESFSSRGPSIMVTSGGNTFQRETPKITATDDVQTKVGQDGNFGNPFTGTSAAAPHVAAIAGLYYSRFPSHSTGNFFSAMTSSASTIQTGQGGVYNSTSGFGKIRAYEAIVKSLVTLTSPQVTTNTSWVLVRVTGTATIAADRIVTIPATTTTLLEGSVVFGNVNAKIHVEGTLILAQGASVNPEQVLTFGNGRIVGGDFVTVIVTQVDINNSPFGSVERWRSTYFEPHAAPYTFGSQNNAQETFRALQDFKPGTTQKYHDWETYTNVANHQRFTIDPQHNSYKARFAPTEGGITIKTDLIDLPGTTGGDIQFRDPWYTDSLDAVHGSNPLNRGMQNAVFRNRPSPFNPDYDTEPTPGEQPYRGVFLNENPNWLPDRPNYSVGAPQSQTIGGHPSHFIRWTGHPDSVAYQNTSLQQTGVVFKQAGATATALYKGHLRAQSPFATGPSSQRKVIHAAGVTHAVYESGGSIWYIRNDGTGWSDEIPIWISSTARNPSIGYSTTSGTYLQIVWTDQVEGDTSNWKTYYKLSTNLGLAWWTEPMVLAGPFSEPTNPIVCSGYYSAVIWRGWDGLKIMHDPWRTPSWQYYTISHTGETARDFSTTQRSGYEWMSDGANTSIANSDGQLFVAWDALDARSGIPTRSVFVRERRADQSWTRAVAFSHCSHQSSSPVVGIWTYNGANVLDLLWQCGNHVARGTRLVANPLWSPVSNLGPGNGPTIIGSMLSSGSILGGWMTGTSAPYVINFQQLPPPQFERWNAGWNVAGIAVRVPNYNRSTVFPDAIGPIYKFVNGQYQPASDPLDSNRGYWVQFPSTQPTWPISYNGTHIDSMAMPVQSGWNIIGSISVPIDTLVVTSIPTGIRISPFWKYQPGYAIADKLNPGMGYWVKSSNNGHLILKNGAACPFVFQTPKDKFTITDSEGYQQELYVVNGEISENAENIEMPPTPPEAEFDVRWESGDYQIVVEPTGEPIELPIDLNAVSFPITLEWELDPENGLEYAFIPSGGLGKAPAQLTGTGRLTVPLRVHKIRLVANGGTSSGVPVLPTAYALGQNYPNPFNPTTTLRYDLPEDATVSLRVYDVLGREVAVLADGVKSAGYHAAIFDGWGIASGVYLARFTAADAAGVLRYTHTTKLLLTK